MGLVVGIGFETLRIILWCLCTTLEEISAFLGVLQTVLTDRGEQFSGSCERGTLSSAGAARSCPPISAGLGSAPDPAIPSSGEDAGHGPGDLVAQWSQVLAAPSPSKLGWFRAGFKSLCPGPWALGFVLGHTSLLWVWIPVFGHFCPFCALCSSRGSLYQSPPH